MNIIWQDLRFFIDRLSTLRVSETLPLGDGGFCVSTNNESENWVYYPASVTSHEVARMVMDFFYDKGEFFMWPVYDGGAEVLREEGLLYAGELTAMSLDPKDADMSHVNKDVTIERVTSRDQARLWARTAWHSFGGGADDTPEDYYEFAEALSEDEEGVSMFIALLKGEAAGTFMITHEAELMGIYFVGTLPEFRGRGIASSMLKEVCGLSRGKEIVLQATPKGEKVYNSFGFKALFKMPVYSNAEDLF